MEYALVVLGWEGGCSLVIAEGVCLSCLYCVISIIRLLHSANYAFLPHLIETKDIPHCNTGFSMINLLQSQFRFSKLLLAPKELLQISDPSILLMKYFLIFERMSNFFQHVMLGVKITGGIGNISIDDADSLTSYTLY